MSGEQLYEQYISHLWEIRFLSNQNSNDFIRWSKLSNDEQCSWNFIANLKVKNVS